MHRQRKYAAISGEDGRSPVAVVNVQIHDHGALDQPIVLQGPNCHCHVVNRAKSFAVAWKRMMKSAADVEADALHEGIAGCQNSAARCQPESGHHLRRIGNLQL